MKAQNMKTQNIISYGKRPYYNFLTWLLIFLILGRLIGLIASIYNYNKPKSSDTLAFMNSSGYDVSMIISAWLEICTLSFIYLFITNKI